MIKFNRVRVYAIVSLVLGVLCVPYIQAAFLFFYLPIFFGVSVFTLKQEKTLTDKVLGAIGAILGASAFIFTLVAVLTQRLI
jgi:hypothetical protein